MTYTQAHFVRCANPDDPDYERLPDRQRECEGVIEVDPEEPFDGYECPRCGRPITDIRDKQITDRVKVDGFNQEELLSYVSEATEDLPVVEHLQDVDTGTFEAELSEGNSLHVVCPRYAPPEYQQRGLFFNPPTLFVHISPLEVQDWTVLERRQHIFLSDYLTKTRVKVAERVSEAAAPIEDAPELEELLSDLEDAVERHSSDTTEKGTYFELVCRELLRRIRANPEAAQRYLNRLKRLKGTIFGEIQVQLGGAGGTDIISINKYELLQQLFEGGFIADAKCYGKSTLGQDERREVMDHLESNDYEADHAIVLMYGEDIAASTWRRIYGYKRNNDGRWRILIIPQYLFLELVHIFDARDIFAMDMNESGELVASHV
ncbi:hypothetical protein [Salinibacter sp.]|uniref:hypothetical protein n=1 Tax=Salinibacter sp. TaxID=2065818 RepID=UPI0021E88ECD|nr:hypothetical protein [Salinibacter sp.]